ncbi:beta-xylosidase [Metarhizium album ARSEF 1941]|uniref:Beta-xylosidase n=1 Tax=Metarhizium album (strain ARSEF 1941) TaxID=1081103 RepID=A0A0B2WF29_METAS|nr:beta-xylosidase [Metarhizium album ARSEF 1941]KHN94501.1 beta-xylosidase [Metarhizium album ARSEF 1941]
MMHREMMPSPQPHCETFIQRRLARNPDLAYKLHQMALPLSPLVQLTTGAIHPDFPQTVLQFWLLTDAQLESLAHFYHQKSPSLWTSQYPCPVVWLSDVSLEEKRRRMGKFIGLRGCDSPSWLKSEDEIAAEARLASIVAQQEETWRKKVHPW